MVGLPKPLRGSLVVFYLSRKQSELSEINSFEGEGFVGVRGVWKDKLIYIVNAYALCNITGKRRFVGGVVSVP